MEPAKCQIKTKWCCSIGKEVEFRETLNFFDPTTGNPSRSFECLQAGECPEAFCLWAHRGTEDPLVNIEEEIEM